ALAADDGAGHPLPWPAAVRRRDRARHRLSGDHARLWRRVAGAGDRVLDLHPLAGNLGAGRAVGLARADPVLGHDFGGGRAGDFAARSARPGDAAFTVRDAADCGAHLATNALWRDHADAARPVVALGRAAVHEPDAGRRARRAAAHRAEPHHRLA